MSPKNEKTLIIKSGSANPQGELQRQVADWQRLHGLSKRILAATTVQAQLEMVLASAAEFLGSTKSVISLHDEASNSLVTYASVGMTERGLTAVACVAVGDGACGVAFAERRQVIVKDTELDPVYTPYRGFARQENIRSVISTPVYDLNARCIGVISIYLSEPGAPDERALRLIDICASYVAPLIERERVKEELGEARDWSRKILETIGEGFLLMDRNFRITQINAEGLRVVGLHDPGEVLGKIHWEVFPGSESLESGRAYKRVLEEQVSLGLEQLYPVNGVDVWFDVHAYPTADGLAVFFRDITARVKASQAMEESNARLHELANKIPQLAWMASPDGNIHWYNDRWYQYTGKSFEELAGWGWECVHDPETLPSVRERWLQSIASGEEFQMTFPLLGADGKFRPFFTLVSPLRDAKGAITQWFGTNTDVSPLREAEQAVRNSEERLREGLFAGQMAVWEWDLETDRIEFSSNAPSLFGESWDTAAQAFQRVHPEDLPALQEAIEVAVPIHGEFRKIVRLIRPDTGAILSIEFRGKVLAGDSAFSCVRGICIDISERVRAEESLRQADKRKDEFLAMLAHELRNPLAPISTAAQLLKMPNLDMARVRNTGDIIIRQVRHMTSLVDDLLDVSRVTRGLATLHLEPTDLKAVVNAAVEQVRPLMESRHHALTVRSSAEPAFVRGDKTRLVQVIANLLNNAAKYTPQGGDITLSSRIQDGRVQVEVSDNGIGIDAALLPHVFELFAQGERTPDRSQGGLGLGLSLVKSLVELHEGQVRALSKGSGQGSTFEMTLPRAEPPAQVLANDEPTLGKSQGSPLKLMVVDDNRDAAYTLGQFLEAFGHEVTVFCDAKTALSSMDQRAYDSYILDIGLPDMNGYELAKRLRAKVPHLGTFVALTGYGQEHDRVLSKAAGFDHHLVKPVDVDNLLRILAEQSIRAQAQNHE